jgi:hypothetical protein
MIRTCDKKVWIAVVTITLSFALVGLFKDESRIDLFGVNSTMSTILKTSSNDDDSSSNRIIARDDTSNTSIEMTTSTPSIQELLVVNHPTTESLNQPSMLPSIMNDKRPQVLSNISTSINNTIESSPIATTSFRATSFPTKNIPSMAPSQTPTCLPTKILADDYRQSNNDNNETTVIPENLHIAFIGDSVTRYQYLDFVYYLHTGRWVENTDNPNLVREKDYSGWIYFFNHTNAMFDGKEKCDCWRGNTTRIPPPKIFEVRYYADPIRNNYISYFTKFGVLPVIGHWRPEIGFNTSLNPLLLSSTENTTNTTNNTNYNFLRVFEQEWQPPVWSYDWIDIIRYHIKYLQPRPTYLVLNAGLWIHDLDNRTYLEDIQNECHDLNITTIYKTSTSLSAERYDIDVRKRYEPHELMACQIFDRCMNLTWTRTIFGPENYWDGTHFQASVNRVFNEQLLEILSNHSFEQYHPEYNTSKQEDHP